MPLCARRRLHGRRGDEGVSLLEVIVALMIIAGVMVSAGAFFINGLHNGNLQTQRQAAVTLANQAVEATRAVTFDKLLQGRTQTAVNALNATTGASALTGEDVTATSAADPETLNFDPAASTPGSETVKLTAIQTEDNVVYTVRTFINVCWFDLGAGTCTRTKPPGAIAVYRATSWVTWSPGRGMSCPTVGGCAFAASTLIDKQSDPRFNSNISSPIISGITPTPVAANSTRALTVTGVSFKAGTVATISAGGGSLGAVSNNTGTSLNVTLTAGSNPGSYVFSIVNPDGGRANYSLTVNAGPTIASVTPGAVTNGIGTSVTISGTGFQSGAVITMTNGTVSSTSFVNATSMMATLTPTGSIGTTVVTVTNPDGGVATAPVTVAASQPSITSGTQSGSTGAVGVATQITLSGSQFDPAAGVTVTSGAGTVGAYTTRTSNSFVFAFTPSSANAPTTFTLTNPDGGNASTSVTVATLAPPSITSSAQTGPSPVGTAITITLNGTNFSSTGTVTASAGTMGAYTSRTTTQFVFSYTPLSANPSITFTLTTAAGSGSHTRTVNTTATSPPTLTSGSQTGAKAPISAVTQVTLNGANLGGASVSANSGSVGAITSNTAGQVVFNFTPTGRGSVTFTVTTAGGSATQAATILVQPTISAASSRNANKSQATVITITGTGFTAGTTNTLSYTYAGSTNTLTSTAGSTTTSATFNYTNPGAAGTYRLSLQITNGDNQPSGSFPWSYTVTN